MNLLYIADPNSVHDIRWISACARRGAKAFLLPRERHHRVLVETGKKPPDEIVLLPPLEDPSTIRPWSNWKQVYHIRKIIKENKIDLLHLLYAEPNALWARFKSHFNVPIVITTRGTDVLKTIPDFFQNKNFLHRIISRQYRNAFNKASAITATSHSQIMKVYEMGVTTPVELIRTGVDFGLINQPERDIASTFGIKSPFVLMPRSMRPLYNHEFTLQALSLLKEAVRKQFTFVFVDSDTPDRLYFASVVEKSKMLDVTTQFIPSLPHTDMMDLYKQSRLVVMNPLSDGSPVTAMEAMACRTPVILPPLSYDPEIFSQVFKFADWTPKSLTREIERALEMEKTEMSQLCALNFDTVRSLANSDSEMNKLFDLYHSCSGK